MNNIWKFLKENKEEAIKLLKDFPNQMIDLDELEDENKIDSNDYCFVLIQNNDDEILDLQVTKIKLAQSTSKNDGIDIFIDDWQEWVSIGYTLSASEDNVYQLIEKLHGKLIDIIP